MSRIPKCLLGPAALIWAAGCAELAQSPPPGAATMQAKVETYTTVRLETDLGALTDAQRRMLRLMIEAAEPMNDAFWIQAYGDRQALLDSIEDPPTRRFAEINYGPWDRLDDNASFVVGFGEKPLGANFYPEDVTKEEIESGTGGQPGEPLRDPYTMVRRNPQGRLIAVPYHEFFAEQVRASADKLREAAELAVDPGLRRYLELRADALLSDLYRPSDLAWMDMKDNRIDIVIGPIENYEDKLYNAKTAYEAYVLVKDMEWSTRLARYKSMLPDLQRGLPVPEEYKKETPGTDSDLNAYDVIYYAGDCNSGSKTIAINLPNDEEVQAQKGSRRLQLKNAMRAKYDRILVPIAEMLIAADQRETIGFDAFFGNTMFHEVAHGLGIKRTLDGKSTVREALQDRATILEEGKADVLGLYMVTRLHADGELDVPLESHYVTFLAGIFRSIRFGAASSHGKTNMIRFNFFEERGAFSRDEATGTYRVDMDRMRSAVDALSEKILTLQGDGSYDAAKEFVETYGSVGPTLQHDLDRLAEAGVPVDIVFEQGIDVLGL